MAQLFSTNDYIYALSRSATLDEKNRRLFVSLIEKEEDVPVKRERPTIARIANAAEMLSASKRMGGVGTTATLVGLQLDEHLTKAEIFTEITLPQVFCPVIQYDKNSNLLFVVSLEPVENDYKAHIGYIELSTKAYVELAELPKHHYPVMHGLAVAASVLDSQSRLLVFLQRIGRG